VNLFKSRPGNIDKTPTEIECVTLLRQLCQECPEGSRNNDVQQIELTIAASNPRVIAKTTTLFSKVLMQSKGLLVGETYRNLDYVKHPEKNSNSKYSALMYQSNEIKIAIKTFEILDQITANLIFSEAKALLNTALEKVEENKKSDNVDHIATKNDWVARFDSNEKVTAYVERLLNICKTDSKFCQSVKDFTDSTKIDKAIKQIKTKAYIVTQQDHIFQPLGSDSKLVKKRNKLINKLNTSSGDEKNRLRQQINELENKIVNINILRKITNYDLKNSMGINASNHTIGFVSNDSEEVSLETSSGILSAIKLDRCGHIDNSEAADDYVRRMALANKDNTLSEDGKILLIDNRLMYDTALPMGEAKLIRKHQRLIDKAIVRYNNATKPPEKQLAIAHLNLPSKTYLGMNKQNTQNNRTSFVRILKALTNSGAEFATDPDYKIFFNFMRMHQRDENYFCGENGHKMAFAMKILCNKNKGIPSGGCKSAKDRDGAQKVFDEVYSALLCLKNENNEHVIETPDKFFDNIPEKYLPVLQNVVIQNGIGDITRLNTSFPGSKNFSALILLLNRLGFKDRSAFKGQSSNAKG